MLSEGFHFLVQQQEICKGVTLSLDPPLRFCTRDLQPIKKQNSTSAYTGKASKHKHKMENIPRASIHVGKPANSFSSSEGAEPERRGWDEEMYNYKNNSDYWCPVKLSALL